MICYPVAGFCQEEKTFVSAEAAVEALVAAAQHDDVSAIAAMLGPAAGKILTSGDSRRDKEERAEFARVALTRHQLEPDPMNRSRVILSVGEDDWPFPVPIVFNNGRWHFDASVSTLKMRAREIGANELDAIEICAGYVEAQKEFASPDRDDKEGGLRYARYIKSSARKSNGLYSENAGPALVPLVSRKPLWMETLLPEIPQNHITAIIFVS